MSHLTRSIEACASELDSQSVANILVGLHSSSSDHPEVTGVLDALAGKLTAAAAESRHGGSEALLRMTDIELSMALWGFYGMSCDKRSVRAFLGMVNANLHLRHSSPPLTAARALQLL